jgi:hypothetical protein
MEAGDLFTLLTPGSPKLCIEKLLNEYLQKKN